MFIVPSGDELGGGASLEQLVGSGDRAGGAGDLGDHELGGALDQDRGDRTEPLIGLRG